MNSLDHTRLCNYLDRDISELSISELEDLSLLLKKHLDELKENDAETIDS